jgi:hypothetical protein
MTLWCRLFGCAFQVLVNDGGALRLRCTRCGCQSPGCKV